MDDREMLVANIEKLETLMREHPDDPLVGECQISLDLGREALAARDSGVPSPAHLHARMYRRFREHGDDEYAEKHRANLHAHADDGDAMAIDVLGLLSDDPFWREP